MHLPTIPKAEVFEVPLRDTDLVNGPAMTASCQSAFGRQRLTTF